MPSNQLSEALRQIERRIELIATALVDLDERQRRILTVQSGQELRLHSILSTLRSDLRARRRVEGRPKFEPPEELDKAS